MEPTTARQYSIFERHYLQVKFSDRRKTRLPHIPEKALLPGSQWAPLHRASEHALDEMRESGQKKSGQSLPDLNNWFIIALPDEGDAFDAAELLLKQKDVEYAKPLRRLAPLLAPDFSTAAAGPNWQEYLGPAVDNAGVDAFFAWQTPGGDGADVRVVDVEVDWNADHVEFDERPLTWLGFRFDDGRFVAHGTAVMSIIGGSRNGSGVTGIAHNCEKFVSPSFAGILNIAAAVTTAAHAINEGDVILIEQGVIGPNAPRDPVGQFYNTNQTGMVAAEWDRGVYDAVKTAVACGRIVVAGAANGDQDLDDPSLTIEDVSFTTWLNEYHAPFRRANDSGAILVGAGNWSTGERLSFSNYGSRLDVQAWGNYVVAATAIGGGMPADFRDEGENALYTFGFNGTSSASAIVAGACAALQGVFRREIGRSATPAELRQLLVSTGVPQPDPQNGRIGPRPNLRAAIEELHRFRPPIVHIAPQQQAQPLPLRVRMTSFISMQQAEATQAAIWYTTDGSEPAEGRAPATLLCSGQDCAAAHEVNFEDPGLIELRVALFANDPVFGARRKGETAAASFFTYTPQAAPAGFAATQGEFTDGVKLSWTFSPHARGFEIWTGARHPDHKIGGAGRHDMTWFDHAAPADTSEQSYWLRADLGGEQFTWFAGPVNGWRKPPQLHIRFDAESGDRVRLTWDRPVWEFGPADVLYHVYRSAFGHPATSERLATIEHGYLDAEYNGNHFRLPVEAVREFDDLTAAPGHLYFYWVIAVDELHRRQTTWGIPAIGGVGVARVQSGVEIR